MLGEGKGGQEGRNQSSRKVGSWEGGCDRSVNFALPAASDTQHCRQWRPRRLKSPFLPADWDQNLCDARGVGRGRLKIRVRRARLKRGLPQAPTWLDHRVRCRRAPRGWGLSGSSLENWISSTGLRLANTQPEMKLLH